MTDKETRHLIYTKKKESNTFNNIRLRSKRKIQFCHYLCGPFPNNFISFYLVLIN